MFFLKSHGLRYMVKYFINPVYIISGDEVVLARTHAPKQLTGHRRACTLLLEATVGAPFEETVLASGMMEQAQHINWGGACQRVTPRKRYLFAPLGTVPMVAGEDPNIYFARVDNLLNTLKSVGVVKEEREIVKIIIRK